MYVTVLFCVVCSLNSVDLSFFCCLSQSHSIRCVCVCEFFWVSWCDDKCARASKRPLMTHLPSEYVPVEHLYTHTLPINGFAFENKIHHLVCFILKILLPVFGIYYTGFWCDVCGIFVFLLFFSALWYLFIVICHFPRRILHVGAFSKQHTCNQLKLPATSERWKENKTKIDRNCVQVKTTICEAKHQNWWFKRKSHFSASGKMRMTHFSCVSLSSSLRPL